MIDSPLSLSQRARAYAAQAHAGQVRPNESHRPWFEHLEEVAKLVEEAGGGEEEIAGALLQDSIQHGGVTLEQIRAEFGEVVASFVDGLTDPPEFNTMPVFDRKIAQAQRLRFKPARVKRLKMSGQISNVRSVVLDPPPLWKHQERFDYVRGAWVVIQECIGLSGFLDAHARAVYRQAREKYPDLV